MRRMDFTNREKLGNEWIPIQNNYESKHFLSNVLH